MPHPTLTSRLELVSFAATMATKILKDVSLEHDRFLPKEAREHLAAALAALHRAKESLRPRPATQLASDEA